MNERRASDAAARDADAADGTTDVADGGRANPLLQLDERLVIGHRGAPSEAPENTLESFRLAVAAGADAIELDVHLSADGVPVVIHDAALRRTTDREGAVASLTAAEIALADAGHAFTADGGASYPWRGRDVRVPTLEQVLTALPDTPLLLELKTPAVATAARALIARHSAGSRVVPSSAHHAALDAYRAKPWRYGASAREIAALYFGTACGLPPRATPWALLAVPYRWRGLTVPTRWFIRAARARGAPVHVWTVDDPALARRLWMRGACGMVTNVPATLVEARAAMRAGAPA